MSRRPVDRTPGAPWVAAGISRSRWEKATRSHRLWLSVAVDRLTGEPPADVARHLHRNTTRPEDHGASGFALRQAAEHLAAQGDHQAAAWRLQIANAVEALEGITPPPGSGSLNPM